MNKNEKESEQEKIINRRRICAYLGNNKEVYEIVKVKSLHQIKTQNIG